MKAVIAVLFVALLAGCNDAKPASEKSSNRDGGIATAPVDYLDATAQAQQKAIRTVDVVALNKAVEEFYVQEGRFPRTLEELEDQGVVRAIPVPPPGMKLNYDTNTGVVTMDKDSGNP